MNFINFIYLPWSENDNDNECYFGLDYVKKSSREVIKTDHAGNMSL